MDSFIVFLHHPLSLHKSLYGELFSFRNDVLSWHHFCGPLIQLRPSSSKIRAVMARVLLCGHSNLGRIVGPLVLLDDGSSAADCLLIISVVSASRAIDWTLGLILRPSIRKTKKIWFRNCSILVQVIYALFIITIFRWVSDHQRVFFSVTLWCYQVALPLPWIYLIQLIGTLKHYQRNNNSVH